MQKAVLPLFYMAPISWFAEFISLDDCLLEQWENFPKQTYRNRMYIFGPNGKQLLSIPICHKGKMHYKDVEMSMMENWQANHWKSIKNAYQSSPYFEFYEDKFRSIYETSTTSLLEFNKIGLEIVLNLLKLEKKINYTSEYQQEIGELDFRNSFNAKVLASKGLPDYYQTYNDKHGFLEDLSIVDLLCNLGPESVTYLKRLKK